MGQSPFAAKTWLYLRSSMVALVLALFISIIIERSQVSCWQTSISAYYYTPVQSVFVGVLVALGACLIALRGNTDLEDVVLNFAGMLAPVVALVPTPQRGDCTSAPDDVPSRDINIANNMLTLLILGAVVLGFAVLMLWLRPGAWGAITRLEVVGLVLAGALLAATWYLFAAERTWFTNNAHPIAAISLFAFIIVAVICDAWQARLTTRGRPFAKWYWTIAGAMVGTALVVFVVKVLSAHNDTQNANLAFLDRGWHHWVGIIEATEIALFAVFWIVQTVELLHAGFRDREEANAEQATRHLVKSVAGGQAGKPTAEVRSALLAAFGEAGGPSPDFARLDNWSQAISDRRRPSF
jgi:hypothetical protein